jgi:plasmid maintenance system killer protein
VAVIKIAVILLQEKARKNSKAVWIIIGNSHYRLIFYLGKKEYIPGKGILK